MIAMATSQFEYGLRQGGITNSVEATNNILKHPRMETLFDDIQFRRMKDWNSVGECLSGVFGLMCILVEKLMRYVAKAFATVEEKDLFARMRDDKVNPKFAQVTQDFRERMSTVVHNKTEEKTLGATKSATNKNSEKAFSDDFDEVADEQNTSSKPLC